MIIFGFRRTAATMAMLTLACRNGHVAAHRLVKATRWFTLFFIPLIPFNRKYLTVCAQCGTQVAWSKADALAAAAAPQRGPSVAADPVAAPIGPAIAGPSAPASALLPPSGPPAGWYPDPSGRPGERYWSGTAWTDEAHPA